MMAAKILFWISFFTVFHSYVLFPLIIRIINSFRRNRDKGPSLNSNRPFVSILISAFNEEGVIEEKITGIFRTSYPSDRFEVLVGSDASADGTDEIILRLMPSCPGLRFFPFSQRQGKPNVINRLEQEARGDILVITDANVLFDTKTLEEIIAPFSDPGVGLVDTRMINLGMKREGISYQEKAYISREVRIKDLESRLWGTMMGPFGGCFAVRRKLYEPVPSNFLVDDFFLNMKVLESGFKAVNNPNACVFEDVSNEIGIEFRRKIRISTGNFQNLARFNRLLFSKVPGLSFCFWSHKVLRWIGPFFLLLAAGALVWLSFSSVFYLVLLIAYAGILTVPLIDMSLKKLNLHIPLFRFITHFLAMNLALLIGFTKYLKGVKSNVWQPTKRHQ